MQKKWVISGWPPENYKGMGTYQPRAGIKVTHIPSGISATCNKFRSQHQNRDECMKQIKEQLNGLESSSVR